MYIPEKFMMEDERAKRAFMKNYSFACLVTQEEGGNAIATHLPFVFKEEQGKLYLVSHLAKANRQGDPLDGQSCLVIFSGPHAYISPRHYEATAAVPTWDYVAVHAYGRAEVLHAVHDKLEMLESMIASYEPNYQQQWDGLPEKFKTGMLQGFTAFRIEVTLLQGQAKLSQNKSLAEQIRIEDSLSASQEPAERALADYMRRYNKRDGDKQDGDH